MENADHARHVSLRDRVDALLKALPIAVAVMSRDGVVRYGWNAAAESLFGRTKSEAVGRIIPLLDSGCSVDFADLLRRAATGEAISGTELRYERWDGSTVYASVSLAPAASIVGNRRGPRAIIGLFEDITQRKRAEALLRENEERFRSVFEDGQLGMAIVDADTRIVQANRRMAEVFGCAPRELAGVMVKDLSHPDDVPDVAARVERLAAGNIDYFDAENRYIREDGSTLVGRVVGTLIGSADEERSRHIIVMLEDVTARRQTQEELSNTMAKLRQSMRQAILAMAHIVEVRDPYTAGHQERVACLARAISHTLGLPEDEVSGIYHASLVHDIGKISIPGEILSKPAGLAVPSSR